MRYYSRLFTVPDPQRIVAPHVHKWNEGHVYDDGSVVTETYTCTECGKPDSQIIKEYIKLSEAAVNYHYDGCEPVYCGEEIRPVIDVYYNGSPLVGGCDFEVTYSDNIKAGKATAKITGLGDCIGERTIEYVIDKADNPPGISISSVTVENQIEYVRDVELPEGWEFIHPEQHLLVGSNNGILAEYMAGDKDNYKNLVVGLEIIREGNANNITEATSEESKTEKTTEIEPREESKTEKTTEIEPSEEIKTEKTTENNAEGINNEIIYKNNVYRLSGKKAVFVRPVNSNVKSLTIPNKIKIKNKKYTVSAIEGNACYGMKKLQNVTVGNSVITVGEQAFADCTKLKKISFGSDLVKLGNKVMAGDGNLKKITFKSSKIKSFGKKTFDGVPGKVDIIIPRTKMKSYIKLIKKAK